MASTRKFNIKKALEANAAFKKRAGLSSEEEPKVGPMRTPSGWSVRPPVPLPRPKRHSYPCQEQIFSPPSAHFSEEGGVISDEDVLLVLKRVKEHPSVQTKRYLVPFINKLKVESASLLRIVASQKARIGCLEDALLAALIAWRESLINRLTRKALSAALEESGCSELAEYVASLQDRCAYYSKTLLRGATARHDDSLYYAATSHMVTNEDLQQQEQVTVWAKHDTGDVSQDSAIGHSNWSLLSEGSRGAVSGISVCPTCGKRSQEESAGLVAESPIGESKAKHDSPDTCAKDVNPRVAASHRRPLSSQYQNFKRESNPSWRGSRSSVSVKELNWADRSDHQTSVTGSRPPKPGPKPDISSEGNEPVTSSMSLQSSGMRLLYSLAPSVETKHTYVGKVNTTPRLPQCEATMHSNEKAQVISPIRVCASSSATRTLYSREPSFDARCSKMGRRRTKRPLSLRRLVRNSTRHPYKAVSRSPTTDCHSRTSSESACTDAEISCPAVIGARITKSEELKQAIVRQNTHRFRSELSTSAGQRPRVLLDTGEENDKVDQAATVWSTLPFFGSKTTDFSDGSQGRDKGWSSATGSCFRRPFAGSSLSKPVKEAKECEIPYLPCQTICGTIGEYGALLKLGNVTLKYPASSLPLHSHVAMMTRAIEPGFLLDGEVAFSPQVSVGPHCECQLDKPITLCLPLKVQGEVTVLVSKTAAGLAVDWQEVPASNITIFSDYVEVTAVENCVYQAQCGCKYIIVPGMEYTFFSISTKVSCGNTTLLLRCYDSHEACTRQHGHYQLCHHTDETVAIRAVHGDALRISLKSVGQRDIKQFNTPFDISKDLDCVLDEQFDISVGPPLARRAEATQGGNNSIKQPAGEEYHQFCWRISLGNSTSTGGSAFADGVGELRVQTSKLSELEVPPAASADSMTCKKCHKLRDVTGVVGYLTFTLKAPQDDTAGLEKYDSFGVMPAVDRKFILKIFACLSKSFQNRSMCDSLAIFLNVTTIERDFVQEFKAHNPDERQDYCLIARQIMQTWLNEDDDVRTWPASKCLAFLCRTFDQSMERKDLKKKCSTLWQYYGQPTSAQTFSPEPPATGKAFETPKSAQPPFALLLEIARAIPDKWTCVQLAIALDIGDANVEKVEHISFTHEMVFTCVLRMWQVVKGGSATKGTLLKALQEIHSPCLDIAEHFRKKLSG